MDYEAIIAMITLIAVILPILIRHEYRLTRIEAKIDLLMKLLQNYLNERERE